MTAVGSSAEDNNRNLSSHNIEVQQFYLQMIKKKSHVILNLTYMI